MSEDRAEPIRSEDSEPVPCPEPDASPENGADHEPGWEREDPGPRQDEAIEEAEDAASNGDHGRAIEIQNGAAVERERRSPAPDPDEITASHRAAAAERKALEDHPGAPSPWRSHGQRIREAAERIAAQAGALVAEGGAELGRFARPCPRCHQPMRWKRKGRSSTCASCGYSWQRPQRQAAKQGAGRGKNDLIGWGLLAGGLGALGLGGAGGLLLFGLCIGAVALFGMASSNT